MAQMNLKNMTGLSRSEVETREEKLGMSENSGAASSQERRYHGNGCSVNMSAGGTRRDEREQREASTANKLLEEAVLLRWDAMPPERTRDLLNRSAEQLQEDLAELLVLRNHQTCMREAALLDYYVYGFCWAKEAKFTPMQISFIMAVLHMLLENIREKQMSLVENLLEFAKALAAEEGSDPPLGTEEATALVNYTTDTFFQKYTLFLFLFSTTREESLAGTERQVEVFCEDAVIPLEEGLSVVYHQED